MNDEEKSKLEQALRKAAPLLNRLGDGADPLPAHVRARLNAALDRKMPLPNQQAAEECFEEQQRAPVRESPLEQIKGEPSWLLAWRWWIRLTTVTTAVVLIVVFSPLFSSRRSPIIQFAREEVYVPQLTTGPKELSKPHPVWTELAPVVLSEGDTEWLKDWPTWRLRPVVKVLYQPFYNEVSVHIKRVGRSVEIKTFPVADEKDLPQVLNAVNAYIEEQTRSKR